ncbi:MAG: hypothetical protein J6R20_09190 [Clostridia bacterium]|nr:hypothetical protein [Clostridia bacterium]
MSKKKTKKKSSKKLPIIIASVAGAVAVILLVVFVIAPAIKSKIDNGGPVKPTSYEMIASPAQEGDTFEYVIYRNLRMPKEVAEILEQGEKDNAEACEKYGVAVKIGNHSISRPVYEFYYNMICAEKTRESLSLDLNGQTNTTGFDYNLAPDNQDYPGSKEDGYTWADKFNDDTIKDLQFYYAAFEGASTNGIALTENQFQSLIYQYEYVNTYAEGKNQTVEQYLSERSGEHITYEMYATYEIMRYYAAAYQEDDLEKYKANVTQGQIDDFYKEYEKELTLVKARIYPIESYEYDEAELQTLKTEYDFLNYATQKTNQAGYNASIVTRCWWVDYSAIANTYGPDVADWIFIEKRTPGEIGLVQGAIFPCLVYIETPPFISTSRQVVIYEAINNYGADEAEIEKNKGFAQEIQQEFLDNGGNKEAALKLVEDDIAYNKAVSTSDYGYNINVWLFAADRKPGDYTIINTEEASYFIYYLNNNPDDYDWVDIAIGSIGAEAYDTAFQKIVDKNYSVKSFNRSIAAEAWNHSYEIIVPYIQERKDSFALAHQQQ